MPLVKNRIQLFCKVEATDGTFTLAAPAAADLVPEAFDVEIPEADIERSERNDARGNLTKSGAIIGGKKGKLSFKMRLIGGAAAGTATAQSNVWKSAGFSETIVAVTSVTYKRANDSVGYSYAVIVDGHLVGLEGCRADMTIDHEMGQAKIASVSVEGVWVTPTDVAFVTPAAQPIAPAPWLLPASLSVMGYATAILKKLSIKIGNKITVRPSVLDAQGYLAAKITDARPTASVDPEATTIAEHNRWTAFLAGTTAALSYTAAAGDAAGNKLAFTCAAAQWSKIGWGDRDGIVTHEGEIELTASQSAGEGGDYSFIWT